ncbi:MAG TPA: ABC transporter ATP-binding protein [Candidatus Saccharimonadales bacterium]|nr:ABC transporter ATP-binding protein [Candidatus Saccharimonadales bacterium]
MDTCLEIRQVVAGYGYGTVLRGATLNVPRHQMTCLIGPNGAGKSTLLRAISGLIAVQSGEILLDGVPLQGLTPRQILEAGVVHVPQDRSLFPTLSVWENLLMGGYILRDNSEVRRRALALEERFPTIRQFHHSHAGSLSGGQQRIIEFARALMLEPKVVLADEPSLGLDPKSRTLVFETLTAMSSDGITVLLVEQNARSALRVSDHAAVLELGTVRIEDRAPSLLDNPEVGRLYLGASAAAHRRLPHAEHVRT